MHVIPALAALGLLGACASVPLTDGTTLTPGTALTQSDALLTKTRQHIDRDAVLAASSVRLQPATVSPAVDSSDLTDEQIGLVKNALNRALCAGLSRRFQVVEPSAPADLTVRPVITSLTPTNVTAAGASNVINVGGRVAGAVTGLPIPTLRLPLGLGGLAVEAAAITANGEEVAAMTWARGADVLTTKPRISADGDAYALATAFASDFSSFLVKGTDPMKLQAPDLPSSQQVSEFFGGKAKYEACEQFGRNPGLGDIAGGALGLPPSWTDAGEAR